MKIIQRRKQRDSRRGAALVEFAVIAPLFMMLILGTLEIGAALRGSSVLFQSVRGGARLAAMDYYDMIPDGSTGNEKVESDIRNFLKASGVSDDLLTINITHVEGGGDFDLDDPDNKYKLFRVEATLPYSAVSNFPNRYFGSTDLRASLVMRAGRSTLSE